MNEEHFTEREKCMINPRAIRELGKSHLFQIAAELQSFGADFRIFRVNDGQNISGTAYSFYIDEMNKSYGLAASENAVNPNANNPIKRAPKASKGNKKLLRAQRGW